jgi:hypothetical protein
MVLPSGNKLTVGLLVITTFAVVPFRAYEPFTWLLPSLNASWKSYSVRAFCTTCDPASSTSFVSKWRRRQSGKQRKFAGDQVQASRVDGDDSHVVLLVKEFPGEEGSARRRVVVMQRPDLL